MSKEEELNERLEAYLDGELNSTEAADIQRQIETDEDVAEAISMLRLERELGELMIEDDLEAKMREWESSDGTTDPTPPAREPTRPPRGRGKYTGWLWLLLLLIMAALLGWALFGRTKEPPLESPETSESTSTTAEPEEKTTTVPEPAAPARPEIDPERPATPAQPGPPAVATRPPAIEPENRPRQLALAEIETVDPFAGQTLRGADDDPQPDEPPITTARRLIADNEIARAREILEAIPTTRRGEYLNARQYLAYLDFQEGDYAAAILKFTDLIEIGYLDRDKMRRYLGLSYLATGAEEQGLTQLRLVAESGEDPEQRAAAQAFLTRMDED